METSKFMRRVKHKTCKLGREGITASPLQYPVNKLTQGNSASYSKLPPLKANYTRSHLMPTQPVQFINKRLSGSPLEGQPFSVDASPIIGGGSPSFYANGTQPRPNWSQLRFQRPPMRPARKQFLNSSSYAVLPK